MATLDVNKLTHSYLQRHFESFLTPANNRRYAPIPPGDAAPEPDAQVSAS